MNPAFAVIAGIAALLGLGCLWFWKKTRDEIALMIATQTSRAADVASIAPGTLVEVKGTIRCVAPLTGEFSGQPCVYAKSEIERREVRWRDGKRETHTVTERSTERHAPFAVEDESGKVTVRGEGASVTAPKVFDQSGNTAAESLVSMATTLLGAGSQDRRFVEYLLAPDSPVYVLGTVIAGGTIGAASAGAENRTFIVTHESEEQRIGSGKTMAIVLLVLTVLLFAGAAAALWASFAYR